ncbi:MAG: hypothetical protein IJ748_05330 [Bacteroidales bacterium]|nr:hypothetical protein [Bacteroidales bacterium]
MKEILLILIVSVVLIAVCFLLIAIKMLIKKNGEFKRHCSSVDPYTGERTNCFCGHSNIMKSDCKNTKHSVLEVDTDLLKEALR